MRKSLIFMLAVAFLNSIVASGFGQTNNGGPYWFYSKPALAKRKTIPVSELTACMRGDTLNPSVKGLFKKQVTATANNAARLLDSGACDVALAFDDRPDGFDRIKADHSGFAIYRISGDNLVLVVEPVTVWIAVGRMEMASQQTLEKSKTTGCGDGAVRDAFSPNPRIWKDFRLTQVKFANVKTASQKEQLYALLYGCDVWIFSPDGYKEFSAVYGTKYPLFDASPDKTSLTRKK